MVSPRPPVHVLAPVLLFLLACAGSKSDSSAPDPAPAEEPASSDEEVEDERPPGNGSCCADGRCTFGEYPGRREWSQACREQGADMGQWCPGECMLNRDTIPPECVCM